MFRCKFCQREFETRRALSFHFTKMEGDKFDTPLEQEECVVYTMFGEEKVKQLVEDYKNEKLCCADLKKTTDIVKYITLLGIKRTNSEEKLTKRYKENYEKSMKERYGDAYTNPSQLDWVKKKKEETAAEKYGSYDEYLRVQRDHMLRGFASYLFSEKYYKSNEERKQTCLELYGHENFGAGEAAKQKRMESMRQRIDSWSYEERLERTAKARANSNSNPSRVSKPEKRIRHCLTELNIDFMTNVYLGRYNYDIFFDGIVIEVQGDYWHANPNKYKPDDLMIGGKTAKEIWDKDKKKRKIVEDMGFELIEIWETEIINKSDIELVQLLREKLCS